MVDFVRDAGLPYLSVVFSPLIEKEQEGAAELVRGDCPAHGLLTILTDT